MIISEKLKPRDAILSENRFLRLFGISRVTVRKAIAALPARVSHGVPNLWLRHRKLLLRTEVINDGLTFDNSMAQAKRIEVDQEYEGIHIHIEARLGTARIRLQIDIGFGDAITPKPKKMGIPVPMER